MVYYRMKGSKDHSDTLSKKVILQLFISEEKLIKVVENHIYDFFSGKRHQEYMYNLIFLTFF